ncbi:MAG: hypothetical protein KIS91_13425 [Anaerolineae bacterium]|nr:hypothetical protein [Anaerolineae bacterium]
MAQPPAASAPRQRNWAVWVLAALAVIAGLLALYDAARYMGWAPISLGPIQFVLPTVQWLGAIMSAIVAVIWFMVAKWIYDLNPSGWMFVVIMAIIYLVLQFLAILGSTSWQSVMWGVLVCVLTLILAFLPGTKRAFGQ